MQKVIVINNCGQCPYKDTHGGFGPIKYIPYCKSRGRKDLPYTVNPSSQGKAQAIGTGEIPEWCPLADYVKPCHHRVDQEVVYEADTGEQWWECVDCGIMVRVEGGGMKDTATDRQLSKSLRQAALRFEAQTREIASLTATTKPLTDKLSVFDFIPVFRKAKSNEQLRIIMDMIDRLCAEDAETMAESDWTLISRVVLL